MHHARGADSQQQSEQVLWGVNLAGGRLWTLGLEIDTRTRLARGAAGPGGGLPELTAATEQHCQTNTEQHTDNDQNNDDDQDRVTRFAGHAAGLKVVGQSHCLVHRGMQCHHFLLTHTAGCCRC